MLCQKKTQPADMDEAVQSMPSVVYVVMPHHQIQNMEKT